MIKTKKQMFAVIAVFTLLLFVGGTTYAFFNYTRTGAQNTVRTGTINFSSSETGNTVTLNNVFPVSASTIGTANESANDVRTVEVTIDGNTTYNGGIEYVLTLDDVNIETDTTPKKEIPLSLNVTVEGLDSKTIGTPSDDYFTERGTNENPSTTALYSILAKETAKQDEQILVGYIPKNVDVKGKVIVKAYIDASKILITDTPAGNNALTDGYTNGTDTTGKTVITTTEWNSLNSSPLSFKVKVEAREEIWVPVPQVTITYNANGGTVNPTSKQISASSTTYGNLPNPSKTNYVFDGWYTSSIGGTKVISTTPYVNGVSTTKLYAHWNRILTEGCFTGTLNEDIDEVTITDYDVTCGGTDAIIPNTLQGYNVVTIGANALNGAKLRYYYNQTITSVSIPEGIKYIETAAFAVNNFEMSHLQLPDSLIEIGSGAFSNNVIQSLTFSDSGNLKRISGGGFGNVGVFRIKNSNTIYNKLPDGLEEIGGTAFVMNDNTNIIVPTSVTTMPCSAIYGRNITYTYENPNFSCSN